MTGMEITEVLGNLGEFLGAIAVFGTIVYLAIQVRLSREATEANTAAINRSASQFMHQTRTESSRWMASDPALTEILMRGLADNDALSEEEWARFVFICAAAIHPYEQAFLDYRDGRMSEEIWQSQRAWIDRTAPGLQRYFERDEALLNPSFVAYLKAEGLFPVANLT